MAAYRRVYDSRHLQADCQEPGSAPVPYARKSSMGYIYLFIVTLLRGPLQFHIIVFGRNLTTSSRTEVAAVRTAAFNAFLALFWWCVVVHSSTDWARCVVFWSEPFSLVCLAINDVLQRWQRLMGDWKRDTGKRGTVKNAWSENAGLENAAPIKLQDW